MPLLIQAARQSPGNPLFDGAFAGAARAHCCFCATRSENLFWNAMARSACGERNPSSSLDVRGPRPVPPNKMER